MKFHRLRVLHVNVRFSVGRDTVTFFVRDDSCLLLVFIQCFLLVIDFFHYGALLFCFFPLGL